MSKAILLAVAVAAAEPDFTFESMDGLGEMHAFIQANLPVGTERQSLRNAFVESGGATLKQHPTKVGVEKYIYDINLCGYYVWRWNISADYDAAGKAKQVYVNGEPALADGETEVFDPQATKRPGTKESIVKAARARPEATKGESSLAYLLYDLDSDPATIDDQQLIGAGPTRADPLNMGKLHAYRGVDPWRSIFDSDEARAIAPYSGDCAEVDAAMTTAAP